MAKRVTMKKKVGKSAAKQQDFKWGGIGSDAVKKATGRGWEEWGKALDKVKADKLSHKEIAALVADKFGVAPWWSQMVTVGYEQARGLREKHQVKGGWSASVSRTLPVDIKQAFRAVNDAAVRKHWLKDELKITKATPHKSVRIAWHDGTRVAVGLYDKTGKGGPKTQLAFQHEKLKTAADVARVKKMWGQRLEALENLLAG